MTDCSGDERKDWGRACSCFLNAHRTSDSFSLQSLPGTAFSLDGFCGELPLSLNSLAICEACISFSCFSVSQKSGGKADTCYRNAILPLFLDDRLLTALIQSAETVFKLFKRKQLPVPLVVQVPGSLVAAQMVLWMSGVEYMLKLDQGDLLTDVKAESERTTWDGLTWLRKASAFFPWSHTLSRAMLYHRNTTWIF